VIGLVYDALVLDKPRGSQANPGGHPAKPP
jgi:hypothetical protein